MKMSYVDFTSSTFRIKFCVAGEKAEVTISPLVDDEWVTTTIGEHYYDVNLWLDDNVGKSKDGLVRFGVYHVKPDPDNSTDGLWITDSKLACSNECSESSIELVNC
jgi:hypothetical protein